MSHDLTDLLREWPFQPGDFMTRAVTGDDGRPLLQIRVDLGILQMELDGRPDGQASALAAAGSSHQDPDHARSIRAELTQFDSRAQVLLVLGEHARAAQDADHMLQCARWLAEAAGDDPATQHALVRSITLRARAASQAALAGKRTDLARLALEGGLAELKSLLSPEAFENANEVHLLNGMKDLLVPRLPGSQRAELEDRLRKALAAENYELAAILRDELRMM
ncbi:MAG: UvrB/UvrC motif-containing protein [Phycisphaerales bacterium]|jgi:hypothetical protein|nr:UvrB/UvrC motif-containing protein [Phycisphaerales bacterium]